MREFLDLVHSIIIKLKEKGVNTSQAEEIMQQAETAYSNEEYKNAENLANQALELVLSLEPKPTGHITNIIIASTLLPTTIILLTIRKKRQKINTEKIFKKYPWLREDQKDVVRFLAEKKDGIFESELRKVQKIPKSSMWRLIKRLEEENILEVTQLKGQNYIKLKKP